MITTPTLSVKPDQAHLDSRLSTLGSRLSARRAIKPVEPEDVPASGPDGFSFHGSAGPGSPWHPFDLEWDD